MEILVVLIVGMVELAVVVFFILLKARRINDSNKEIYDNLEDEIRQKKELLLAVEQSRSELAPEEQFLLAVKKYQVAKEFLKEEQGRYVIAQAELDSLENRLRELDEAARELEASSTETKEELKIIEKKQNDLKSKNEDLRTQIDDSTKKIEELVVEIELSTQMRERVLRMKSELLKAEERIGTTMVEIDRLNDQYFTMKKKYDALDVEFAQLFQQFSERK
jgi:chromosome segregation ATPase